MYSILRPILFNMEPERAHEFTLAALEKANKTGMLAFMYGDQHCPVNCMGVHFKNPVGLAAGLDKNGSYIDALSNLGFGFIEVGTVTPRAQVGNLKPRLFRLKEAGAIINRMGFNNQGVDYLINNIERAKYQGVLGINIGKNATTPVENAVNDYVYCLERVYHYASYITINISSPNTKNLRDLQSGDALITLLDAVKNSHSHLVNQHGHYVPLVLKVAPDLDTSQIEFIAKQLLDFEIDGLIATNTTLSREAVAGLPHADETGGLSGLPVFEKSTQVLLEFKARLQDEVTLIGVGGIDSDVKAVAKKRAGADLIQLYTGLIYKGPHLIQDCIEGWNGQDATFH